MPDLSAYLLNPSLLWLAAGALAPIIIHLAARERPKPTPFPAVRFIQASHRRSATQFKIKQLLLLLLRVMALALFAFVIARPWFEGKSGGARRGKAPVTAVIVLDTSYSMLHRHEDATSFARAKEMALAAVDAFALGKSRVCLLFAGPTPQPVISDFEHAYDLEALKAQIRRAKPSYRGGDCAQAVAEAERMLADVSGAGKSIFVFTDLTQRAWPRAVPAGDKTGHAVVYVADCGPERQVVNPAVLALSTPPNASTGADFEVAATVNAVGAADRQVELTIDGDLRGRVGASAHRVQEVRLAASATKPTAEHWGRVAVTGRDGLPVDNRRYFTFRSRPPVSVVLVNGAPSSVPRRDELHLLRTALAPGGVVAGQTFRLTDVTASELDTTDLAGADVVLLCNVGPMSPKLWTKVRRFVSTGGGLVVFGGDNVTAPAYEPAATGERPLLPCLIGMPRTPPDGTRLEPGRLIHPILHKWKGGGGLNGDLTESTFRRYNQLTPAKHGEIVIAFKTGDPALVAGKYGIGSVLVYASTCDLDWNTLPKAVPYPVLMHEMLKHLVAARGERRDVAVGLAPEMRLAEPGTVRSVTLERLPIDELRESDSPERSAADVTDRLNRRSGRLNLPAVQEPGLYRVVVARAGAGQEDLFFAVNIESAEADLERLEQDESVIKSLLPGREVRTARTTNDLLDHISRSRPQSELASDFAGILLAILLAEMYLSNHMRARVARPEPAA